MFRGDCISLHRDEAVWYTDFVISEESLSDLWAPQVPVSILVAELELYENA